MTFEIFIAKKAMQLQPCIGDEVMILLPNDIMLCTYLGMKIISSDKIVHTYCYRGEVLEANQQVGFPYDLASEYLN